MTITQLLSNSIFLSFVGGIPLYGALKGVKVYETFIEGAKEGFQFSVSLLPHLVAMLVAVGMFRAAGGFTLLAKALGPFFHWLHFPTDVIPLALVRPFSGSASNGILVDIINTHGGNSYIAKLASTMMGSTETTFYVVAVYFGAINIKRTRHAIPAGLIADFAGLLASVWICSLLFR